MRLLRLVLIGWLAIAVPTTAAASIVNAGHCQRLPAESMTDGMNHAEHGIHAQDPAGAPAMAHGDHQTRQSDSNCTCGCNCFNQHCTTSFSGLTGLHVSPGLFDGAAQRLIRTQPGHVAAAHPLDLLRPPTLS
jgi:hypothetical protein